MTRFCPRCGDRNRGYAVALPCLPVWSTCEGCASFQFRAFFQAVRRFSIRLLGRPQPAPINAGVTIVPGDSVDLFEFLAPSAPEALPTDVVDQWLENQERAPARSDAAPVPAKTSHDETPSRQRPPSSDELHLFLGDEDAPAPGDELLADEWSVSRLVH